jgi:hypothetical protein
MPYLRQALAGFGVVWSRSRLMRLAPGAGVPEHADINYHWHTRVRLHIPVFTQPAVRFHCDGEAVHMAAGEAWIFDNWRRHHVENNVRRGAHPSGRRHHRHGGLLAARLRADAAARAMADGDLGPSSASPDLLHRARSALTGDAGRRGAAGLIDDLRAEITLAADTPEVRSRAARFDLMLQGFVQDWRQLCGLHGIAGEGKADFQRLAGAVHQAARPLAEGLVMRTNRAGALLVLEKRVLQHLVADDLG